MEKFNVDHMVHRYLFKHWHGWCVDVKPWIFTCLDDWSLDLIRGEWVLVLRV